MKKNTKYIGSQTLVYYFGDTFPFQHGNCFDLVTDNDEWYRILYFNVENLNELLKRKIIDFPIEIETIGERTAIITDERIPKEWFDKTCCEGCSQR